MISTFDEPVWPGVNYQNPELSLLSTRQINWPNWNLPGPFITADLKQDLFYPEFFLGKWKVYSFDLVAENKKLVKHEASFKLDSSGRVIGDRAFNAKSLGKQILGEHLIDVVEAPNSPNSQLALFNEGEYLETKVIGRRQETTTLNTLLTDELYLQIVHSLSPSRINQVETLSRFSLCQDLSISFKELGQGSICGEQWQVRYNAPGETLRAKVVASNHYLLLFIPQQNQLPSIDFLSDLANQIKVREADYH